MSGASAGELPELLARVAEAVDLGTALKLAHAFGGREFYIPVTIGKDHPLAKALGLAQARAVAAEIGHGNVVIPLGPASDARRRNRAIDALIREGRSDTEIWAALNPRCHILTIRRRRRKLGAPDPDQPGLFSSK